MQQNAPFVAVVTPVYNGARFLREALEAVQAQTYPNLVHFLLDNASTDATPAIIDDYRGRRVPVVSERNEDLLPLCQNWNKCVELGTRDSVYFRVLCADDTMPPDSIEKMVRLAESDPAILAVGSECVGSDGRASNSGWPPDRDVFDGREALRWCLGGETSLAPTHMLYRTSVLALRPKFFDESVLGCDTEAVLFLLSQDNARFGFVNEALGFVRWHADSISTTITNRLHTDYFEWLQFQEKYAKLALPEDASGSSVRRFWRHYLGRLLVWRFRERKQEVVEWHRKALASIGRTPTVLDYADALIDFAMRKAGVRPTWRRHPQG